MLIVWILLSIIIAVAVWLGFWTLVTLLVQKSGHQKKFTRGWLPQTPPDGFHKGAAHLLFDKQTPWLGKSFDRNGNLGFNIFTPQGLSILKIMTPLYKLFSMDADGNTKAYYFKTYVAPALKDAPLEVVKLDYDSPENPFLIRIILDEIVETAPDTFLGKVHLKVFPRFYATIGFFGLKKV